MSGSRLGSPTSQFRPRANRVNLSPGDHLGRYEILTSIGAGGMGEVWRARDTELGREVAIKVLPPKVADSPERRKRFEREARATAALNHPNLLTVHDVGAVTDNGSTNTELSREIEAEPSADS